MMSARINPSARKYSSSEFPSKTRRAGCDRFIIVSYNLFLVRIRSMKYKSKSFTMPRRYIHGLAVLAALTIGLGPAMSVAAEKEHAPTPYGLRIFYTGHSFHMFIEPRIEQLVKSAGIEGHQLVGKQGIGGSRVIQHWELAEGKNKARAVLEAGNVDVFTMAAHLQLPDPGIDNFVKLGLEHNPNAKFLIQASWMPYDLTSPEHRIRSNSERDQTKLNELEVATNAWRTKLETQAAALNAQSGRQVVFIVPVGNAVNELRARIVVGTFPGVETQSALFRDPIGHGLGQIQALTAYCNFAAIYQRTPEELRLNEAGVSEEQHKILQQIAWKTVSNYSHSGLSPVMGR